MVLVENDDRTMRKAQGADLVETNRQYPGWLGDRYPTAPEARTELSRAIFLSSS